MTPAAAALRLVGPDPAAAARIAAAPAGYLTVHDPADVARHCTLLSPRPGPGEVRVAVTPGRAPGEWRLDIAGRDRPGLLAACTGVLARFGVDVAQAVVATWDDGAALEAFIVRAAAGPAPDGERLRAALAASLDQPLWSPAVLDAQVSFDSAGSSPYTACVVRAADRPGLLHAVAVAFAHAGVDIHAARVETVDGAACDRFDLSPVTPALEARIRETIRTGVAPPKPKPRGLRLPFARRPR